MEFSNNERKEFARYLYNERGYTIGDACEAALSMQMKNPIDSIFDEFAMESANSDYGSEFDDFLTDSNNDYAFEGAIKNGLKAFGHKIAEAARAFINWCRKVCQAIGEKIKKVYKFIFKHKEWKAEHDKAKSSSSTPSVTSAPKAPTAAPRAPKPTSTGSKGNYVNSTNLKFESPESSGSKGNYVNSTNLKFESPESSGSHENSSKATFDKLNKKFAIVTKLLVKLGAQIRPFSKLGMRNLEAMKLVMGELGKCKMPGHTPEPPSDEFINSITYKTNTMVENVNKTIAASLEIMNSIAADAKSLSHEEKIAFGNVVDGKSLDEAISVCDSALSELNTVIKDTDGILAVMNNEVSALMKVEVDAGNSENAQKLYGCKSGFAKLQNVCRDYMNVMAKIPDIFARGMASMQAAMEGVE